MPLVTPFAGDQYQEENEEKEIRQFRNSEYGSRNTPTLTSCLKLFLFFKLP